MGKGVDSSEVVHAPEIGKRSMKMGRDVITFEVMQTLKDGQRKDREKWERV